MNIIRQTFLPCLCVLSTIIFYQAYNSPTTIDTVTYAQESPAPITPAKAKIKGPSTVMVGTLLFLSAEEATGDNFKWLIPPELIQTSASCNNNIFFSIPTPGKYSFGLVAANKLADIDVTYHDVIVTFSQIPNPAPISNTPSFDKIVNISKEGLLKLNDPPTAANLKLALSLLIQESANKTLAELRTETIRLTVSTFLARKGESLKKEWGQLWVEPIDAAIVNLNLKDAATYVELLKALVKTL